MKQFSRRFEQKKRVWCALITTSQLFVVAEGCYGQYCFQSRIFALARAA